MYELSTFRRPGFPDNVRVNADCSGIDQVEEWIAVNPIDHRNVVVSHNDGVKVGMDYSLSGGAPSSFGETELRHRHRPVRPFDGVVR